MEGWAVWPTSRSRNLSVVLLTSFPAGPLQANCYVVARGPGTGCALVDPGMDAMDGVHQIVREHNLDQLAFVDEKAARGIQAIVEARNGDVWLNAARGIVRIANAKLPAAVLMCTNRLSALDPAGRRRAADVLSFARPGDEQRRFVLSSRLEPIGLGRHHVDALVTATGPQRSRDYGFTYSDLTQRLLPAIVLDAYPSRAVDGTRAVEIARAMIPTPPFRDGDAAA